MTERIKRASKEALFCIGSNCGDRVENVAAAMTWLSGLLRDFRHSTIYATPDSHGGQRIYMNAVCVGETFMDIADLDMLCKEYELSHGRDTAAREAGDVPVDLDAVVFDGKVLRTRDFGSEFFLKGLRELSVQGYRST